MLRLTTLVSALALSAAAAMAEDIKVGVSPGEHAEIMEEVAKVAAPKGLNIEVIEFSDYVVPNQALNDGDLNANSFQHRPYLENQIKDRGFELVEVGTTITTPMGVYSDKIKDLADLPEGGKVAIPNDPTNGGRVLLLLQSLGLIKLKEGAGLKATPLDVVSNPKKLRFVELDAAQLPRSLDDLDASAINTNFAISAGLNPKTDSIALESAKNPYVNILVIRDTDKGKAWVGKLINAYHSEEVRKFIETQFKGSVISAF